MKANKIINKEEARIARPLDMIHNIDNLNEIFRVSCESELPIKIIFITGKEFILETNFDIHREQKYSIRYSCDEGNKKIIQFDVISNSPTECIRIVREKIYIKNIMSYVTEFQYSINYDIEEQYNKDCEEVYKKISIEYDPTLIDDLKKLHSIDAVQLLSDILSDEIKIQESVNKDVDKHFNKECSKIDDYNKLGYKARTFVSNYINNKLEYKARIFVSNYINNNDINNIDFDKIKIACILLIKNQIIPILGSEDDKLYWIKICTNIKNLISQDLYRYAVKIYDSNHNLKSSSITDNINELNQYIHDKMNINFDSLIIKIWDSWNQEEPNIIKSK